VVPQRDDLLDAEAMRERFAALLATGGLTAIEGCRRLSVRYYPGQFMQVLYAVDAGGTTHHVAARTFDSGARCEHEAREGERHGVACGPLRPLAADPRLRTVYWTFPNDRALPSLPRLAGRSPTLAGLLGRPVDGRIVKYAPEVRAVARCVDDAGTTVGYAKLYGPEAEDAHRIQEAVARRLADHEPTLRVPRVLGWSASDRIIVSEPVVGPRIRDLPPSALELGMQRLGTGLARLHALPAPPRLRYGGARPAKLRAAARLAAYAWPEGRDVIAELLRALIERWPAPEGPLACMHGDLNEANVVVEDGRLAILDLDRFALGPAAADLGGGLARLRYERRAGRLDQARERRLGAALLDGYAEAGTLPSAAALRWHTAATLLTRRVAKTVVRVRAKRLGRLPGIIADARELLD